MVFVPQAQRLLDLRSLHRAAHHEDQPFDFLEDLSGDLPGNQPSAIVADRSRTTHAIINEPSKLLIWLDHCPAERFRPCLYRHGAAQAARLRVSIKIS